MNIADRVKTAIQTTNAHSLQEVRKQFLELIQKRFPKGEIDHDDMSFGYYHNWHYFTLEGPAEVDDPERQIIEWIDEHKDTIARLCLADMNPFKDCSSNEREAIVEGYYNV